MPRFLAICLRVFARVLAIMSAVRDRDGKACFVVWFAGCEMPLLCLVVEGRVKVKRFFSDRRRFQGFGFRRGRGEDPGFRGG